MSYETEEHGVVFRIGPKVARIEGTDAVAAVVLRSGERPATDFIAGLPLADGGSRSNTADGPHAACSAMNRPTPACRSSGLSSTTATFYIGHHTSETNEEVFWGAPEDRAFLAFYDSVDGRVLAVAGMGCDAELAAAEELLRLDGMLPLDRLRLGQIDLVGMLRTI